MLPIIDAIWVRKWKRVEKAGRVVYIVKSRLCARGFLDSQGDHTLSSADCRSVVPQLTRVSRHLA